MAISDRNKFYFIVGRGRDYLVRPAPSRRWEPKRDCKYPPPLPLGNQIELAFLLDRPRFSRSCGSGRSLLVESSRREVVSHRCRSLSTEIITFVVTDADKDSAGHAGREKKQSVLKCTRCASVSRLIAPSRFLSYAPLASHGTPFRVAATSL